MQLELGRRCSLPTDGLVKRTERTVDNGRERILRGKEMDVKSDRDKRETQGTKNGQT